MKSSLLLDVVSKCSSWDAFRRALAKRTEKEKGDLFEHLVRAYLLLDPEYATKLRKVWLLEDVPSALRTKLKLPGDDQGIDLIAETNTGEYWAVQCKYREDTARALPWREISTFTGLAFGVCRHISFGLVCSTTERITRVLKHQDRIGFCALDVWQDLDEEFFARLRKLLGHKPAKLAPLKPRPHQKRAIKDARSHFVGKRQKRGKLISPCGSGKSLSAYWIARDLKAKKILVAVPSLALIRQTLKVWLRESLANGDTVEWICVCSDESAGRLEQDDVAVLRQDLGVPCLTDPKEIASWLNQKKPGLTVVFTTYQSGETIAKAARRAKFNFDLGIMDEAHKTVGDGAKLFSHLLHDKNLPVRRRIFMTATERRYRGKGDKVLSMDDPAVYGDTFHLLSFKRALETQPAILSDYRIVTILVSRDEVADLIRKNVFVRPDKGQWNKEIEAEMLAALVALRKAMRKYPIKHAVSFHSSIRRAEAFKEHNEAYNHAFRKHGTIGTFHVSGKTPTGTRARMVKEFAETDRALITNARCLTEGIDVPGIDCVIFADPRRSAVDIVQAVGRALRPAKGKKMGYVIVPILHDAKAKPDDIFDSEEFQEILTTLRALAANDERIIEYFRAVSQGKRRSGCGGVIFDIDERLAKRINLQQFVREIELKCWSRLAKLSWRPFGEAREFIRSLKLKSQIEWSRYCRGLRNQAMPLPIDIPRCPESVYSGHGWLGVGDWLGTGVVAHQLRKYRSFKAARAFARNLDLRTANDWRRYCEGSFPEKGSLPTDIPSSPHAVYSREGWDGMGDWLGTGRRYGKLRPYRIFEDAKKFAQRLKLQSQTQWSDFCKHGNGRITRPADIPSNPDKAYKGSGWSGYGDWLGTGNVAPRFKKYRPFVEARNFARGLGIRSRSEWTAYARGRTIHRPRLPEDIPANPAGTYRKKGWKGYGDWLGTGTIAPQQRTFMAFKRARRIARQLGLKNREQWKMFARSKRRPSNIPAAPHGAYQGRGWKGYGDWLGTGNIAGFLRKCRKFTEARAYSRGLGVSTKEQWVALAKKGRLPAEIPSDPYGVYKKQGWISWPDWLGTDRKRKTKRKG